jgi:hypothetical protein
MSFQIKKFSSIVASMINFVSGATTKVTDFNKGSVVRTLLEAIAMELEEIYYQLLQATEEAIEEAIYRTFNFPRNPAEKATGTVRFTRLTGSEVEVSVPRGSLVGTDTEPSVVFETQDDYTIPGFSGTATGGSTISLIDTTKNFVTEGVILGSKVIDVTDGGETGIGGVTSITTTTNPNDTLHFSALSAGASFGPGDTYKVIVPYVDVPVQALVAGIEGNVAAHALIVLRSNVPNIVSVDNASSFSDGDEEESDLSRKARFALYIQSLARATRGALEYAARTVDQVVAAKAIDDVRPTVYVWDTSVYSDITQHMRNPGDAAVDLLPVAQASGSCLYIGADEPFAWLNMHLYGLGICTTPGDVVWEYYNGVTWSDLSVHAMVDGTNNGNGPLTQSGALSFTIPNDWISVSVNLKLKMWIRLRIGAAPYSTIPTGDYCSLPPGLGYVYLYCHDGSGLLSASLQASVESAVELYRGCGIIVQVLAPTIILPTITVEIVVAVNYDLTEIGTKVTQAIIDYLNAKVLGEDLYLADLYRLIMEVNNKAILNAHITAPTEDVIVASGLVLRANPAIITVTAYQS